MQEYRYQTKPLAKQTYISFTRDEEAASKMIRNNIIGHGPHVSIAEIHRRTAVPQSTLRDWLKKFTAEMTSEMQNAFPQPVSCPNQLFSSSIPSAPATVLTAISQAPLQLSEFHQGFPPVSTLSTATRPSPHSG
jgi:hypothetical protein